MALGRCCCADRSSAAAFVEVAVADEPKRGTVWHPMNTYNGPDAQVPITEEVFGKDDRVYFLDCSRV